jgi:hypothetical protein
VVVVVVAVAVAVVVVVVVVVAAAAAAAAAAADDDDDVDVALLAVQSRITKLTINGKFRVIFTPAYVECRDNLVRRRLRSYSTHLLRNYTGLKL